MKKEYKIPTVKVVRVKSQIIAASMPYGGKTQQTGGNLAPQKRDSDWSDFEN